MRRSGWSLGKIVVVLEATREGSEFTIETLASLRLRMAAMPRPLRIQYSGARYHVMSRGDGREAIFYNDADRVQFLRTGGEAAE